MVPRGVALETYGKAARAAHLHLLMLTVLAACSGASEEDAGPVDAAQDGGLPDLGPGDAGADSGAFDAAPPDASDAGTEDAGLLDSGRPDGDVAFGFELRAPIAHRIPCSGPGCPAPTVEAEEIDYVCDLRYGALSHYVYVQARPVSFVVFMGYNYEVDGAWISDGTTATPITAVYNFGGNHHNETITADVPGYQVRYDHSSYGFGFRQCQPMDCLVVYEAGPGAELENGCTRDRTVPTICKPVRADGTLEPFVDTFMRCPGDT